MAKPGALHQEAHDLALKAAETDATKRALATFGNPFGLALYDRELAAVRDRKALERSHYSNDLAGAHRMRTTARCAQPRGLALKVSDEFTLPLCAIHHTEIQATGDELHWCQDRKIDRSKWQQISGHTAKVGFVRPPKQSPAL